MTYSRKFLSRNVFGLWLAFATFGLTHCGSDDSDSGTGGTGATAGAPAHGGNGSGNAGHSGNGHGGFASDAGTGGIEAAAGEGGAAGGNSAGAGGTVGGSAAMGGAGGVSAGAGNEAGAGGETASPLERFFARAFVKKVVPGGGGDDYFVLLERAGLLQVDYGSPRRRLVKVTSAGEVLPWISTLPWPNPSDDISLLDFALHPSGEITALFASVAGYHLVRIAPNGEVISETALSDPKIALDPPALPEDAPAAPIETNTHDTGRLQAVGEQVVIATRTGRHSVIAYRYDFREAHFEPEMRALVVPPLSMYGVGLTGGSHDTFGQLDAQFAVHVAVDDASTIYVAVQHPQDGSSNLVKAHKKVFGEDLVGDPDALDIYVTRIALDGTRLGTSVVGTPEADELYGLHAGKHSAYVAGRKEYWNEAGTGFDALAAEVDGTSGAARVFELDVDRSDIAFDVAAFSDSELVVVGASGYSQNPHGASISEESQAFAYVLGKSGGKQALSVPNRQRHNEARSLAQKADGRWIVAGMLNGPGTHSGDADATLVTADGFLSGL